MAKEIKTKKGASVGKMVAIGAGLASLGAGAYYFLGPNGKKNQQKATAWMMKMEKEMKSQLVKLRDVSEPMYNKAIDALTEKYSEKYEEYGPQIKAFAKHLKTEWKSAKKNVKPVVKKITGKAKKAIKDAKKDIMS